MGKSRWTPWTPVPNKPTVSVDVKQHFISGVTNCARVWRKGPGSEACSVDQHVVHPSSHKAAADTSHTPQPSASQQTRATRHSRQPRNRHEPHATAVSLATDTSHTPQPSASQQTRATRHSRQPRNRHEPHATAASLATAKRQDVCRVTPCAGSKSGHATVSGCGQEAGNACGKNI